MLSIALVLFIPLVANYIVQQGAERLTDRARETPLLLGAAGSPTELALRALYFKSTSLEKVPYQVVDTLSNRLSGDLYPLHLAYQANDFPIAGTTLEYLTFRGLTLREGRSFALIGECIIGASVAEKLDLSLGSTLISSPAGAFDMAGSFPLELTVTGILEKGQVPEDDIILTDIKTTWIIDGVAHGHDDVIPGADSVLLDTRGKNLVVGPKVLSYTQITDDNRQSFHFHGDPSDYPVHAVIISPTDIRERVKLRGLFLDATNNSLQLVVPADVIGELTQTLFSVRDLVLKGSILMSVATVMITILVFALSIRLRRQEIHTMRMIGATRIKMRQLLAMEMFIVITMSILIAVAMAILFINFEYQLLDKWL